MKVRFKFSPAAVRGFLLYSRIASLLMLLVGGVTCVAWLLRLAIFPAFMGQPIRLCAAIGFVFAGLALVFRRIGKKQFRWLSLACSSVLVLLGLDAVVAHLLPGTAGIAGVIDHYGAHTARASAMMALLAAVGFLGLGGQGILTVLRRGILLRELLGVGTLAIAMASMASAAFTLAGSGNALLNELPLMTGALLLVGALGWMAASPTTGLTRIAVSATLGGQFARALLLPSLLLPALYMFVFKTMETRFGVSASVTSTLGALFTGGTVALLVWVMAALLDRSDRQREATQLLKLDAQTDALTGLGNRRQFDATLLALQQRHQACGEPFVLLMLDIDFFKSFNDSYGHQAGDAALRGLAGVLREALRPQDTCARYGGEEFALLLHNARMPQAEIIAERLLQKVRRWECPHRGLTISIGAAEMGKRDTAESLLQRADMALYQAKRMGRDRFSTLSAGIEAGDIGLPPTTTAASKEAAV